jgi:prepilin-type N-terminal cleavage/methylation domain-containing protein
MSPVTLNRLEDLGAQAHLAGESASPAALAHPRGTDAFVCQPGHLGDCSPDRLSTGGSVTRPVTRRTRAGVTLIEVLVAITLLSMLSVAMLFALRIGLMAYSKTNAKLMDDRRVAGAQRILEQELEGIVPAVGPCSGMPDAGPGSAPSGPMFGFFQAAPNSMRLVSTFSLQQGWRGRPQILELFVVPSDSGEGLRLVVNELPYSGPLAAGRLCTGVTPDPAAGVALPHFLPVTAGPNSFVLADKLAFCRFVYLWPPKMPTDPPAWSPVALGAGWPLAIRVEMGPLQPDPSVLQPLTVTAALHLHLTETIPYGDF